MFLEILCATFFGIFLGVFTGIIPGIHVNLLSIITLSISPFLLEYLSPLSLASFILAIAITHTFVDVLPSTFLGIPDPTQALALFPSQKMVLAGKGYEAIFLILFGALGSLLCSFLFLPLFFFATEWIYPFLQKGVGWILLFLCLFLLFKEKNIWAWIIFLLSGCLGLIVFSLPLEQGLFPLFSGLFGVSALLLSLRQKIQIPPQKIIVASIPHFFKILSLASITGWIASFMPGLGPAQAASIGTSITRIEEKEYLLFIGGLSTVNMLLSLLSFYIFEKTRNGAVASIAEFFQIDFFSLLILFFVCLTAGGIACFLTLHLAQKFSYWIPHVPYQKLSLGIIFFITSLVFLLTGWLGFCVFLVSISIGVLPEFKGVAKSHMMGCLLVPVILYFL